jgi:hypothetical protein
VLHSFQLPELSKDEKIHLALWGYLTGLTAESNPLANRGTVADDEFPDPVQFEAITVVRQMVNERVFQTRDEDIHETFCFFFIARLSAA